jgi:putative transposase
MSILCRVLDVSRSGFYNWRHRNKKQQKRENGKLILLVRQVHRETGGTYGTRRMAKALHVHGISCGRCRARTLMRVAGVSVIRKKKFRVTTDSNHNLPVAPNLLNRQFNVSRPNRVWVGDITYI